MSGANFPWQNRAKQIMPGRWCSLAAMDLGNAPITTMQRLRGGNIKDPPVWRLVPGNFTSSRVALRGAAGLLPNRQTGHPRAVNGRCLSLI